MVGHGGGTRWLDTTAGEGGGRRWDTMVSGRRWDTMVSDPGFPDLSPFVLNVGTRWWEKVVGHDAGTRWWEKIFDTIVSDPGVPGLRSFFQQEFILGSP